MGTYFKSLRRKIGVATLGFACALTAGWVRSIHQIDHLPCPSTNSVVFQFISRDSVLEMRKLKSPYRVKSITGSVDRILLMKVNSPTANTTGDWATNIDETTRWQLGNPYTWVVNLWGIKIGYLIASDVSLRVSTCIFPYWSTVVPLTMLSAWLLFGKPRIATTATTSEK